MINQDEVERRFQTKIWQTSGARFKASRRLQTRERLSVASIAGLSVSRHWYFDRSQRNRRADRSSPDWHAFQRLCRTVDVFAVPENGG